MIARVPLRLRLALAFTVAMAVLLGGAALLLRVNLSADLDSSIDRSLRTRADDVAALVEGNATGLAGAGGTRLADTEDGFAQVIAPDGRLIDATATAGDRSALSQAQVRAALDAPRLFTVGEVIGVEGAARVLARAAPGGDGEVVVVVGASLEERDEAVARLTTLLVVGGPVALVLAGVLGYLLAAAALRPVERMRGQAAEISGSEPGARLPVPPARDELGRLGQTLNGMLERVDAAMDRERAFVADASHELRTPLAIMKAEIELALARQRPSDELRAALLSAGEETDRLERLAEDLLVIARADRGRLPVHPEPLDVGELMEGTRRRLEVRAARLGRTVTVEAPEDLTALADRLRTEQARGRRGGGTPPPSASTVAGIREASPGRPAPGRRPHA